MSIRHKAHKATLDRGYASEWNDDHEPNFADEIVTYFLDPSPALSVSWNFAQTVPGSNPAWALVGAAGSEHAFVVLNTGASTDKVSSMRLMLGGAVSNVTSPADAPVLTLTLQIAAVHDAAGVANSVLEFGFQDDSDALFTQNLDMAIFRVYNGKLHAVTGSGAAETETEIGDYPEYAQYRIALTSTRCDFYVDDMVTPAASHIAADADEIPDAALTVKVSVRSKNNVDSTARVDALGLARLRKAA